MHSFNFLAFSHHLLLFPFNKIPPAKSMFREGWGWEAIFKEFSRNLVQEDNI